MRNGNENIFLVDCIKEWLIVILRNNKNVDLIKIINILIIINKNNNPESIQLKYTIILYMMFDKI